MIKFARMGFVTVAILMLATWTAYAQNMPQMGFQQVALSQTMVRQFLSSYPQLQSLRKKYESQAPSSADGSGKSGNPAPSYATSAAARAEMQAMLSSSGFSDLSEWTKVATSLSLAYGFVKSGKNIEDLSTQTNRAIENIQKNPKMPDAQKQQVIAMMRQQMGRFSPLPGNVELVQSMIDEIKPVMESK